MDMKAVRGPRRWKEVLCHPHHVVSNFSLHTDQTIQTIHEQAKDGQSLDATESLWHSLTSNIACRISLLGFVTVSLRKSMTAGRNSILFNSSTLKEPDAANQASSAGMILPVDVNVHDVKCRILSRVRTVSLSLAQ